MHSLFLAQTTPLLLISLYPPSFLSLPRADRIIILDSLNYIKGYRYELFCAAKHLKTTLCLLYCATPPDIAREWNEARPDEDKYSTDVLDALVMRFEEPDSRNRWDSPLFAVLPDDPLPGRDILEALLNRKPLPPNQSTQSQPLSDAGFLHELDRRTQEVVSTILEAQRGGVAGGVVRIPGSGEPVRLPRSVTAAELRRLRRQFVSYTKSHPVADGSAVPTLFVQYLNSTLA